jgi:hypothetical protein
MNMPADSLLASWLLRFLRRLLSSRFVTGSIKRLLLLIDATLRLFSKNIPFHRTDTAYFDS